LSGGGGGWVVTGRARRDLRRLDPPVQRRVIDALDRLTGDPPSGDVVKLTGASHEWRLRDLDAVRAQLAGTDPTLR